jgi:formylglycine-generating enzyme required for sulfatase activity
MALVAGRVCIDRWEASLERVEPGEVAPWSPYAPVDELDVTYRARSVPDAVPQGYISGTQAERACRAAGKRLCTASEWELGCRGPAKRAFPYGQERRALVCNDDVRARHPVIEASSRAGLPADRVWLDGMHLPSINQLPESLERTGSRSECRTDEGLFDMVGNLHEWIADANGTFRGGYYMDTAKNGEGCGYQTTAHSFDYHDYSTGFRSCADPEELE